MRYIPLTDLDREAMLREIGLNSTEELFASIPPKIRRRSSPEIPKAKTEIELREYFQSLAEKNQTLPRKGWLSFLGGGSYEHFIPSVVDAIVSRGEFATAYTPYQPEVSQGTLQAIFEFQSLIANLFGLDVANASMYDGASATAEAVLMSLRLKQKSNCVYVSKGVHPEYREVIQSYLGDSGVKILELDLDSEGRTIVSELQTNTATVVIAQPNFYGVIEDIASLSKKIHQRGALLTVTTAEAMAFGVIQSPGSQGADFVAGEGQCFGNPLSFGGPYVGLLASKKEHVRQLPGRLVGKTVDQKGRPGYVLTLATREQHIRRERATSNICTNHSLCALRACVYLATLGKNGLQQVASQNVCMTHLLKTQLLSLPGVELVYQGPVFNEFCLRIPISSEAFLSGMENEKILAGIPLVRWDKERPNEILVSVTETKTEKDLEQYVSAAKKVL